MSRPTMRAVATLVLLLLIMLGSIAIYFYTAETAQQEVVVRGVLGHLDANGAPIALGFAYPAASNGLIFFKHGESFYVFLYLSGNGTIQSVSVTTPGFNGTVVAPPFPLAVDNYTEPSVVIFQVFATGCCFNGTVDFNVTATPW